MGGHQGQGVVQAVGLLDHRIGGVLQGVGYHHAGYAVAPFQFRGLALQVAVGHGNQAGGHLVGGPEVEAGFAVQARPLGVGAEVFGVVGAAEQQDAGAELVGQAGGKGQGLLGKGGAVQGDDDVVEGVRHQRAVIGAAADDEDGVFGGAHHFGGDAAGNHAGDAAAPVGGHYDEGAGILAGVVDDDLGGVALAGGDADGEVDAEPLQAALFAAQECGYAVVFGGGDGGAVAALGAAGLPVGDFGEGAQQGEVAAGRHGGRHQPGGGQGLGGQFRPVEGNDDIGEQRHNPASFTRVW